MELNNTATNRRLALNLTANFISFIVTFGINFFLSPYIVKQVGVDAYGFVGLANNFVSYASLIAIALNALAGRTITVKIYENDYEGANKFFTSVLIANAVISGVMLLGFSLVWFFLGNLINIPSGIFWDVKILFAALFFECVIYTSGSVFSVSTYATNKLYLNSLRSIEASIGRAVILVILFVFFSPNICYLGITAALMAVYCLIYNVYYTRKLLPFIKVHKSSFDIGAVKELVASGIWSLIIRLGQILSDGLDLLISNLLINPIAMGVLSLAKTIPTLISSIMGSIAGVFSPGFTILYAQKKYDELLIDVKRAMKVMGIFVNIPMIILIVCGKEFFTLWQPTQDAGQLHVLSILTCCCLVISGGINCLYELFIVVKRIKENAIAVVLGGLVSVLITFLLLKTTSLGIYAIAATSSFVSILRNLAFTAPFGAKCLGQKWYAFYPEVFRPVVFDAMSVAFGCVVLLLIKPVNWPMLIIKAGIITVFSFAVGFFIILNKTDRQLIRAKISAVRLRFSKRGGEEE
ncbi:MAG: oligosaccharide flippase family protein [Lachnospiraceae bacterium]|nr:oligosaccharide flippase family protein [Lachnospiraceae bacterium]